MTKFTHISSSGEIRMVDISDKPQTDREAIAAGKISMQPDTVAAVAAENLSKGNVLATAKLAGIQAAKQTASLIPLCHPLSIDWIDIEIGQEKDGFEIRACVRVREATGVEMEALTAVAVTALTIYDMCKSADKNMRISDIRLIKKTGGRSAK